MDWIVGILVLFVCLRMNARYWKRKFDSERSFRRRNGVGNGLLDRVNYEPY